MNITNEMIIKALQEVVKNEYSAKKEVVFSKQDDQAIYFLIGKKQIKVNVIYRENKPFSFYNNQFGLNINDIYNSYNN